MRPLVAAVAAGLSLAALALPAADLPPFRPKLSLPAGFRSGPKPKVRLAANQEPEAVKPLPVPEASDHSQPEKSRTRPEASLKSAPYTETTSISDDAPQALELADVIGIAEGSSPTLTSASAAIAAAQGLAIQQGLYPNPRLDLFSPQLAGSDSQYSAQLTQEFVVKGKLKLQRAAALRDVAKAELAYARARFDLFTEVRQRFYTVLAGQRRVEVLQDLVAILQKSRETAERLLMAGEGTRTDVLLLDIELQNADVNLQNARVQLEAARKQLAAAAGQPAMVIGPVRGDLTAKLPDYEEQAPLLAVMQHTDVLSAGQEIERTRIRLQRECVEPYPNISVGAGPQYQASPPHRQGIVTITLPLPLWNRNQGNIAAAYASLSRADAELYATQNNLSKLLAAAISRYRSAQNLVERYEQKILPAAEEVRRIIQQGYQQGEFDFLRLLQSQRSLMESNLGYIRAQEDRWNAAAEIANILQLETFP